LLLFDDPALLQSHAADFTSDFWTELQTLDVRTHEQNELQSGFYDWASIYPDEPLHSGDETAGFVKRSALSQEGELIVVTLVLTAYTTVSGGSTGGLDGPRVIKTPTDGSSSRDNVDYTIVDDNAVCQDGAAVNAAQAIDSLLQSTGNYEYSGLLVQNGDGSFGLSQNELSTRFSKTSSSFDTLPSYNSVFGIVHNHVYNTSLSGTNDNFIARYPSAADWQSLQLLAQGPNGANTNNLSLFILDPFGDLREFQYADRALYEGMTNEQRLQGLNLPAETRACS
jgi:hypothetical protein